MASSAGSRDKGILGPGARSLRGGGPDLSQLKSPIQTSLSGTRQVIHALECGTGEVKEVLLEEKSATLTNLFEEYDDDDNTDVDSGEELDHIFDFF